MNGVNHRRRSPKTRSAYARIRRTLEVADTARATAGFRRLCLRAARTRVRSRGELRSGVVAARALPDAALTCERRPRLTRRVRTGVYARAAIRTQRSNAPRLARRIRKERADRHRNDCISRDVARRRRASRTAPVAVAGKPGNAAALRCGKYHRADLRDAALQQVRARRRNARRSGFAGSPRVLASAMQPFCGWT